MLTAHRGSTYQIMYLNKNHEPKLREDTWRRMHFFAYFSQGHEE